jgi:hypothetical protein
MSASESGRGERNGLRPTRAALIRPGIERGAVSGR